MAVNWDKIFAWLPTSGYTSLIHYFSRTGEHRETLKKEIRHDRHTVSLLTHMVITPKYRGKILTGEVGFVAEAVIRGTRRWVLKL